MALLKNVYISSQDYWSVPSFWRTWSLTQCVYVRVSYHLRYESRILCFSYLDNHEMIGYCRRWDAPWGPSKLCMVYSWVPTPRRNRREIDPTPTRRRYTECRMLCTPLSLMNHSSMITNIECTETMCVEHRVRRMVYRSSDRSYHWMTFVSVSVRCNSNKNSNLLSNSLPCGIYDGWKELIRPVNGYDVQIGCE